jgi:hypothetical protein
MRTQLGILHREKSMMHKVGEDGSFATGTEVKENLQFDHKKRSEDGVTMGCYGHMHEGIKYSTSYVF